MSTTLGPHFKDLTATQQILLKEWLRIAKLYPPLPDEELPLEYTLALADLARMNRPRLRNRARQQSAPSNRARQVRVTKRSGALA